MRKDLLHRRSDDGGGDELENHQQHREDQVAGGIIPANGGLPIHKRVKPVDP